MRFSVSGPMNSEQVRTKTIGDYLAASKHQKLDADHVAFREAEGGIVSLTKRFLATRGKRTVDSFHRELGQIMWDDCGMARNEAGLTRAIQKIPQIREEFWQNVNVPGSDGELNQALEKAGRVADFLGRFFVIARSPPVA